MRLTLWMTAVVLFAPLALSAISATAQGRGAEADVTHAQPPHTADDTAPKVVSDEARNIPELHIEGVPWYQNPTWWIIGLAILLVAITIGWAATRGAAGDQPPRGSPPPHPP